MIRNKNLKKLAYGKALYRKYKYAYGGNPTKDAVSGATNTAASTALNMAIPGAGTAYTAMTQLSESATKNEDGTYKSAAAGVANGVFNPWGAVGDIASGDINAALKTNIIAASGDALGLWDIGDSFAEKAKKEEDKKNQEGLLEVGKNQLAADVAGGYSQEGFDNATYRKYGGTLRKFPTGGAIPPINWPKATSSDSLTLYNNSIAVDKFYKDKGYQTTSEQNKIKTAPWKAMEASKNWMKGAENSEYKFNDYYQDVNEYQFKQRELQTGHLNLESPIPLYDKRINPTSRKTYENESALKFDKLSEKLFKEAIDEIDKKYKIGKYGLPSVANSAKWDLAMVKGGEFDKLLEKKWADTGIEAPEDMDAATVYLYDPIDIKPDFMLTAEERKEREKRNKTNTSKKPTKTVTKSDALPPESKVFTKVPTPLNPNAPQQRTTGIPFLAPETEATSKPVAKSTSSSLKSIVTMVRNAQTGWDTPMVKIKNGDGGEQMMSPADYDKWAKQNPNHEKHFAYGGNINMKSNKYFSRKRTYGQGAEISAPEYEVEGKEVVQGQDVNLENQEDLSSDMTLAKGATHENGGVEGEGGERVYSDRLKVSPMAYGKLKSLGFKVKPKQTYGKVATILGRKEGLFEDKKLSGSPAGNKTAELMLAKINGAKDLLFEDQEMQKNPQMEMGESQEELTMAYGGGLTKYAYGDPIKRGTTYRQTSDEATDYNTSGTFPGTDYLGRPLDVEPVPRLGYKGYKPVTTPAVNKDVVSAVGADVELPSNEENTPKDYSAAIGAGVNALQYFTNLAELNKVKTDFNPAYPTVNYKQYNNRSGLALNQNQVATNTAIQGMRYSSSRGKNAAISQLYAKSLDSSNQIVQGENLRRDAILADNIGTSNLYNANRTTLKNAADLENMNRKNELIATKMNARNAFLDGSMKQLREMRDTKYANDKNDADTEASQAEMKLMILSNQNGVATRLAAEYGLDPNDTKAITDRWIRENFTTGYRKPKKSYGGRLR